MHSFETHMAHYMHSNETHMAHYMHSNKTHMAHYIKTLSIDHDIFPFSTTAALKADMEAMKEELSGVNIKLSGVTDNLSDLSERVALLHQITITLFDYSEENATAVSVVGFKDALMRLYSPSKKGKNGQILAYCMVTHCYLPKQFVIASHLWKRAWTK